MSLSSNQRRDQRRRLVVSWNRTAGQAATSAPPRSLAAYDPEALPERQRGPAVLLPTGLGGLALAIALAFVPLVAAIAAAGSGPWLGRDLFACGNGRFARTIAAAGAVCAPLGSASLHVWMAQTLLLAAAVVALIVRLMRRHRRDDFKGRFRAWGWMAVVLVIAACGGSVPVGRFVAAAVTDGTGIVLGPEGMGWWVSIATVVVTATSLWAVLPLHERLATSLWLTLAAVGWATSAAVTCLAGDRDRLVAGGSAAWSLGAACAFAAMLAAARSVIREVRGQCGSATPKVAMPSGADALRPTAPPPADEPEPSVFEPRVAADDAETEYTDGSDREQRHLSKAERKRLRKLARMNGAAA